MPNLVHGSWFTRFARRQRRTSLPAGEARRAVHSFKKTVNRHLLTVDNSGFTLIEFLVVLGILVIAVGSALVLLTSILRGTNQANIVAEVKQNGQSVFDTVDSQIRNGKNAVSITPPSGASSAISVTLSDGTYLYLACFNTVSATANGWIGRVLSSSGLPPSPGSYIALTNRDTVSGVDVTSCSFTVPAPVSSVNPPIVSAEFVVSQGVAAPSRQDFKADVKFETTIALRKY